MPKAHHFVTPPGTPPSCQRSDIVHRSLPLTRLAQALRILSP
jgi:hypothetical protein